MPIYIPAWIRATVEGHGPSNQEFANVMAFAAASDHPTDAELASVATMLAAWVETWYITLVPAAVTFDTVHVLDSSQAGGDVADAIMPAGTVGTANGDLLPANTTAVLSLRTPRGGRRGRGRLYLFPTSELLVSGDVWNPTYTAAIVTAFNALSGDATTNGTPWAVASRADVALHPITSYHPDGTVMSQRDRLPGHRRHRRPTP